MTNTNPKDETMKTTYNVELTMIDELTGQTVKRTIDKTNAMKSDSNSGCFVVGDKASQRKGLENWINERGNEQHETILTLVSWEFC